MPGIGKVRKDIGANVRTFRKKARLTQENLAEKADLHPVNISQVERGTKAVSVEALWKLARALQAPIPASPQHAARPGYPTAGNQEGGVDDGPACPDLSSLNPLPPSATSHPGIGEPFGGVCAASTVSAGSDSGSDERTPCLAHHLCAVSAHEHDLQPRTVFAQPLSQLPPAHPFGHDNVGEQQSDLLPVAEPNLSALPGQ